MTTAIFFAVLWHVALAAAAADFVRLEEFTVFKLLVLTCTYMILSGQIMTGNC